MKIAVVGSRTFNDYALMCKILAPYYEFHAYAAEEVEIISGGARGADALAKEWAKEYGIYYKEFPANWNLFGKSAGPKRNSQMIEAADLVIAFWDQQSTGTRDSIRKALAAKKPVLVVPF